MPPSPQLTLERERNVRVVISLTFGILIEKTLISKLFESISEMVAKIT